MKVSEAKGMNIPVKQTNMSQALDPVSKSIQNQIMNSQRALQELSANEEISAEEKMKKRQELQQQIADLNQQLRQHQMEQRKEKQQAKEASGEDMLGNTQKEMSNIPQNGLSKRSMKAMISATSAIDQAEVYQSVATHLKGNTRTVQSEINLDKKRGVNVEGREKELAKIKGRAQTATSSQIGTLKGANKGLEEAAKKDREEKEDSKKMKNSKKVFTLDSKSTPKSEKRKNASNIPTAGGWAVLSISSNAEKNNKKSFDIQL